VTDPIRERYGAHPDWKIVDYAVNTGKHLVSHINYWDQPDVVARVAGLLERSKG